MTSIEGLDTLRDAIDDDAAGKARKQNLGLAGKGERLVIVAEAETTTGHQLWIEAIPMFNMDQTEVLLDFWLCGNPGGRKVHVTLSPGVVESALREKKSPICSAMLDQYGWLNRNFRPWRAAFTKRISVA